MHIQVHKVEILVIDFDHLGPEGVQEILESTNYPNHCMRPEVKSIETRYIKWTDEHPLNRYSTQEAAYRELFGITTTDTHE